MPQLTRGARELLTHLEQDLNEILDTIRGLPSGRSHTLEIDEAFDTISSLTQRIQDRIRYDLEPLLQRQDRRIDSSDIKEITERLTRIEQLLEQTQSSRD